MTIAFQVKIPMPMICNDFSASYSKVEKPTGIQYIILSIIQSRAYFGDTWQSVMDNMGISEKLFYSLFVPVIEEMYGNMISKKYDIEPDIEDNISDYSLTNSGKEAFSKGVIAVRPETVTGTIAYRPGKPDNLKYRQENKVNEEFLDTTNNIKFKDESIDPGMVEAYLDANRYDFGISDNTADIFDFEMNDSIREMFYSQNINLVFDGTTGEFIIREGEYDSRFVKNNYRAEELIGNLSEIFFQSPTNDLTFKFWHAAREDWRSYSMVIPCEVDFKKDRFTICNTFSCTIRNCRESLIPCSNLDADILSIQTSKIAYEYILVNKEVGVRGLEGSAERRIVLKRPAYEDRIKTTLKNIIAQVDVLNLGIFAGISKFLPLIDEPDYSYELLKKHLTGCDDLVRSIMEIKKISDIKADVDGIIEEVLLKSGKPLSEQVEILKRAGIKVSGVVMAEVIAKTDNTIKRLSDVDLLLTVSQNKMGVIRKAGMEDAVMTVIRDGTEIELSSELSKAQNAHKDLQELKGYLNMKDLQEYDFDLDALKDSCADAFSKTKSSLITEIHALRSLICKEDLNELNKYIDMFEDISRAMKADVPLEKTRGRMLGIVLGTTLEDNLKGFGLGGKLGEMIDEAYDKKIISEADRSTLHNIRDFRNECAHNVKITKNPDDNTRENWLAVVKNLTPPKEKDNEPAEEDDLVPDKNPAGPKNESRLGFLK